MDQESILREVSKIRGHLSKLVDELILEGRQNMFATLFLAAVHNVLSAFIENSMVKLVEACDGLGNFVRLTDQVEKALKAGLSRETAE